MTRCLLLACLLLAASASAQEREVERRVIINGQEVSIDGEAEDVTIERRDDGQVIVRRRRGGSGGEVQRIGEDDSVRVFRFEGPDGEFHFRGEGGEMPFGPEILGRMRLHELGSNVQMFRMGDSPGMSLFSGSGMMGASDVTRERIRTLEREAAELARDASEGDEAAEARLDGVLADLFEARGDARREAVEHLRERARDLESRAAEMEAAIAERARQRNQLIEERKREMLGRPGADW